MYGIALSVASCLRGGTRVDVAWSLDPGLTPAFDPTDAVAFTPGGGRLGELLGGALDSRLIEIAAARPTGGRVVAVELDPIEAEIIGIPSGTILRVLLVSADVLPGELWEHLVERAAVGVAVSLDDDLVIDARLQANESAERSTTVSEEQVVTSWSPTPTLVVMGSGPMVEAVARAGAFVDWNVEVSPGPDAAIGLVASLSPIDGIVVTGHDTEAAGRVLEAALRSSVGYIGSLGPARMQQARADWLAYRGVTRTERVRAPAGIDIGARTPSEVAVSVVAEMIAVQRR